MGQPLVIAQSGAVARFAGRVTGCLPEDDPIACARADSIYELGQELCTINPLVNCYTGNAFNQVRHHYFGEVMPNALPQLERELQRSGPPKGSFFLGAVTPTHADFNIFHHLNNAMLLEPDILHGHLLLSEWYENCLLYTSPSPRD